MILAVNKEKTEDRSIRSLIKQSFLAMFCLCLPLFLSAQVHEYIFNGNFNEINGGPALTEALACGSPNGTFGTQTTGTTNGACLTSNSFCFGDGGGLRYSNPGVIKASYTINVFFRFNTLGGYARVIDFSNSATDSGMYIYKTCLNLYPNGNIGTCPYFETNKFYLLTFVRDGATNIISAYVDGQLFSTYNDAGNLYRCATNTTPIIFFKDDVVVTCENQPGCVKYISLTAQVFTAAQVKNLWDNITTITHSTAVPNPVVTASTPNKLTCTSHSTALTATSPGNTLVWNGSSLSNASNPATASATGDYVVTATDGNGCYGKDTVTVGIDTLKPSISAISDGQISCLKPTAKLTGSGSGNSMLWNGGSLSNASNPASVSAGGNYTVTANNTSNGCKDSATVSVTVDTIPPMVTASSNGNITCTVSSATLTGTSPGNTMVWNGGTLVNAANPATVTAGGTYTVTATDATNGCKKDASITVTATLGITDFTFTFVNSTCGASDGSITIGTVTGGTSPYKYQLDSNTPGTAKTFSNLSANIYSITVIDKNGCTLTKSVTIATNTGVSGFTITLGSENCGQANGKIAVTNVLGGTAPFTYSRNTTFQSDSNFNGLTAGNYTITVKDKNGCNFQKACTVGAVAGPKVNVISKQDISCNGLKDGSITVSSTGGTGVIIYNWNTSQSQTTPTAIGLSPGNYTCTIKDDNNCKDSVKTLITQPTAISLTISTTPTGCIISSGTATATANGGAGGFTYSWNTTPVQNTATANGLGSTQAYTVTATDQTGCKKDSAISISTLNGPVVSVASQTPVSCNNGNDGAISVQVSGGTGAMSYSWNTTPVQTTSTISNLSPGIYVVTVTDAANCSANLSVSLANPAPIAATFTTVPEACQQQNGSITTVLSGGTGALAFSWNTTPPKTTASINGVSAGTYTLTVTDSKNCQATFSATVLRIPAPVYSSVTKTDINCQGASTGSIAVSASGASTLSYSWNTSPFQTTSTISNLPKGTYTCRTTDQNGCYVDTTVILSELNPLPIFSLGLDTAFCQGDSVSIGTNLNANSYTWENGLTQPNRYIKASGTFRLTRTINGCSYEDTIFVREDFMPALQLGNDSTFCGNVSLPLNISTSGQAQYLWSDGSVNPINTLVQAGKHWARITRQTCIIADTIGLFSQPVTTVTLPADQLRCTGDSLVIIPTLTNSINPQYLWSTSETTTQITVKTTGTYVLSIKDQVCTATDNINVTVNTLPIVDLGPAQTKCDGESVVLSTGPANSGYIHQWSTNSQSNSINVTQTNTYQVSVTNINCTTTSQVHIQFNPLPVFSLGQDTTVCPGATTSFGCILPNASYSWNTGENTPFISVHKPSAYELTITQNGCSTTQARLLLNYALPVVPIEDAYLCPLDSLILDAATPGCSYLWENMDTIPTQKIYEPCSKTVTLTDQYKCVNSKTVQIHPDESLECEPDIYVPSSFTPNGDGYNETFFPIFRDDVLDIYEFSIYNTWGELIFNSNTPGEAWNGTVRGQLCQTGVYTWKLNYSFSYSSVKKEMYGLVLLFQ